ncbi:tetratricopeptide repeat protein [Nitrosovibrio sp. Nv17]|uniref:tetratricopeptide repeat protein n=1 Tax=Nitrosovibrio sp. Nv17 TaxID=1855339 RepID=UPI000931FEAF|nr:tetratricopeptide repeat protein [Nitrosovibrio sp. Nv17]
MDGVRVENSENTIAGSTVTAGGDVIVGGQKITNYHYSISYQDLKGQLDGLNEQFSRVRGKMERYPDDEDFRIDLLRLDAQRSEVRKKLDDLKHEVMRLAETFTRIPLNTERLRVARQHFEAGRYPEARTILDAGEMGSELDALLDRKRMLQARQEENEARLADKANEFLILARLTAVDFTLSDRYGKTLEYFQRSLEAAHTADNTFAYAYFLHEHNQFAAALPLYGEALEYYRRLARADPQAYEPYVAATLNNLAGLQKDNNDLAAAAAGYEEALAIYRRLTEANPQVYAPYVAMTLNNLAVLQQAGNDHTAAAAGYEEALAIYRRLAQAHPQAYAPKVATTLNNLANLQKAMNDLAGAAAGYEEALTIRRRLAETHPQAYEPDVAETLNNLALLQQAMNDLAAAAAGYEEALVIRRRLAQAHPQAYAWDVAMTLNNLAILQQASNDFAAAAAGYEEALAIYRRLAEAHPQAYEPEVVRTLVNLGIFYLEAVPDRERSLACAREALATALPFAESFPAARSYADVALAVVGVWGEDRDAFLGEAIRRASS